MSDTEPSLTNFTQGRLLFSDKQAKEAATLPYGCPCRSYCCMRYTVNSCDASAGSGDTRISTAGMKTMKVRGNEDLNMLSNTSLASSNIVATVLGTKLKIKRPVELSPLPQTDSQPTATEATSDQAGSWTTSGRETDESDAAVFCFFIKPIC